jgi:hypothetical protein
MGPTTYSTIDGSCGVKVDIDRIEDYGHKGSNAGKEVKLPKNKVAV